MIEGVIVQPVKEGLRFTPADGAETVYRVTWSYGKHGPFTLELSRAKFTPQNIETEIRKVVDVLRAAAPQEE